MLRGRGDGRLLASSVSFSQGSTGRVQTCFDEWTTLAPCRSSISAREMPPFRELRIIKRLLGMLEIGAAVLPVGIEEKCVELPVEVIMMRGVAPSPRAGIELRQPAIEKARERTQPNPTGYGGAAAATPPATTRETTSCSR
jgi:hypothetical protein